MRGVAALGEFVFRVARERTEFRETSGSKRLARTLVAFAAAAFIGAALSAISLPAKAAEASAGITSLSFLAGHAPFIGTAPNETIATQKSRSGRGEYAALLGYAKRILPGVTPSPKRMVRVAEAQTLLQFLKEGGEAVPPEKPKVPAPVVPKRHAPLVQANYVGTKVCLGCHASQAATFEHTLMGRLLKQGRLQCETCHGPGSEHARLGGGLGVGSIISFRPNDTSRTAAENNAICLGCHQRGDRTYWSGSVHQTRGLACTSCHTIMKAVSRKNQLKTAWEPDTCFQCHQDRRMQSMRSTHMPLREGKIVCSDCHNPHGSPTKALLRGDSINDVCYKCHAEKRGPFLFEHAPVRENCDNCHEPHGSDFEFLLKVPRPRLCAECHTFDHGSRIAIGPYDVRNFSRACQNCHTAVHGSNDPSGALLHR